MKPGAAGRPSAPGDHLRGPNNMDIAAINTMSLISLEKMCAHGSPSRGREKTRQISLLCPLLGEREGPAAKPWEGEGAALPVGGSQVCPDFCPCYKILILASCPSDTGVR